MVISFYHSLCLLSAGAPDSQGVKQSDDGGNPLQNFTIRCRQVGDSVSWSVHVNDSSLVFPVV